QRSAGWQLGLPRCRRHPPESKNITILTIQSLMRQYCLMRITKSAIVDAATRLLAVNPGASTQEIADAAGISRASLHRFFPTRDALVEEIAAVAVERVSAAMAAARLDEGAALESIARL